VATCYRHPSRETNVSCSRCDRPICPDCMTTTPVGMRCPECAGERTEVRRPAMGAIGGGVVRATYVLIGLNVLAFLAQIASGGGGFGGGGDVALHGALCGNAVGDGGVCGAAGIGVLFTDGGEYWRIVTSAFLHAGVIHIGLNMLFLYFIGSFLEPLIGTTRMVAVYVLALVAGALGALLLADPQSFTLGASGAIYGLFGAALLIARHRGFDQVAQQLAFLLVLNLLFTFSISGISIGGHLGGLAGGGVAAMILIGAERSRGRFGFSAQIAALALLTVVCFVAAIAIA
jgi:membrane associated rhomboid family serine protease